MISRVCSSPTAPRAAESAHALLDSAEKIAVSRSAVLCLKEKIDHQEKARNASATKDGKE
jgi:hypothetical protein